MGKLYDVVILGAGPGGLAAGLYAGRARLSTLIIEKGVDGGQIAITNEIENYPGQIVDAEESGPSLIERFTKQAEMFGCERVHDIIEKVEVDGDVKKLIGKDGTYEGKTLIIATGAFPRPIGCEGEKEFLGKGVSYCATCDANFFEDFEVYVVGGHRRDELRAAKSIQERAFKVPNLHFMWNSVVVKLDGDDILQKMTVKDTKTGELREYECDPDDGMFGVFGFIGRVPNTAVLEGSGIELGKGGYIPTDDDMCTNIPGVFAAGDVRVKSLRQVVTAAADGAIAATQAEKYINENAEKWA